VKAADYLHAIVRLTRDVQTAGGESLPAGMTFIVAGQWRGRLTLCYRNGTLGGKGAIAVRGLPRGAVEILATRLA